MKMIKCLFFLIFSTVACANSLPQWTILPAESNITFTATQNNAPVIGSFKDFTGLIFADSAHYQDSSVDVVVNMSSITTSYAELTAILVSSDWFNVKAFPNAEFKSTKFTKKDDKNYEATGILTIKNKSVPLIVPFTVVESPKNHFLVEGHIAIKRTTFAIGQGEWASTNTIKDDVTLSFKMAVVRKE